MPLLSFREFLFLKTGACYPVLDPITDNMTPAVKPAPEILAAFREYRSTGMRAFFSEGNFKDRMLALLDKTLYADIPFFIPNVTEGNLPHC